MLLERYASLGIATNNVAEYSGLIAGLRAAAELGATHVDVRMDSKLVVEQMSGRWQIKNPGLRPLAAEAAELVAGSTAVTFELDPAGAQQGRRRAGQQGDGRGRRQARSQRPRSSTASASTPAPGSRSRRAILGAAVAGRPPPG